MNRKTLSIAALVAALFAWACPALAQVPWSSYLVVTDQNGDSGAFEGTQVLPGGQGLGFELEGVHHLVTTNDGTTGVQHKPLVLTRKMDKASARFFEAFVTQEPLRVFVKIFFGSEQLFEIELFEARIVALEPVTEESEREPGLYEELEKIRFMYRALIVRDIAAGTEHTWQLAGWPS